MTEFEAFLKFSIKVSVHSAHLDPNPAHVV